MSNKHLCGICGRVWKRETERMKQGKTCTKRCASIKGYLSGDRKETGIELKLQVLLKELNIPFVIQKPLLGICVADIVIDPNVVLFADGEYWHSGAKMEYKDGEITRRLTKNGYVVCRLEERDINKDLMKVQLQILEAYSRRRAKMEL